MTSTLVLCQNMSCYLFVVVQVPALLSFWSSHQRKRFPLLWIHWENLIYKRWMSFNSIVNLFIIRKLMWLRCWPLFLFTSTPCIFCAGFLSNYIVLDGHWLTVNWLLSYKTYFKSVGSAYLRFARCSVQQQPCKKDSVSRNLTLFAVCNLNDIPPTAAELCSSSFLFVTHSSPIY